MAKDGLLWLAVPNWGSLVRMVDGERWKWKSWPNHLFYYTPTTLKRLAKVSGFHVVRLWTDEYQADPTDIKRAIYEGYRKEQRKFSDETSFINHFSDLAYKSNMGQTLHTILRRDDYP